MPYLSSVLQLLSKIVKFWLTQPLSISPSTASERFYLEQPNPYQRIYATTRIPRGPGGETRIEIKGLPTAQSGAIHFLRGESRDQLLFPIPLFSISMVQLARQVRKRFTKRERKRGRIPRPVHAPFKSRSRHVLHPFMHRSHKTGARSTDCSWEVFFDAYCT